MRGGWVSEWTGDPVAGLLCTLLSTTSRITYGMAMVGTLPKAGRDGGAKFSSFDPYGLKKAYRFQTVKRSEL